MLAKELEGAGGITTVGRRDTHGHTLKRTHARTRSHTHTYTYTHARTHMHSHTHSFKWRVSGLEMDAQGTSGGQSSGNHGNHLLRC